MLSVLMLPIILILVVVVMLFSYAGTAITTVSEGGVVQYDEAKMQAYANQQYAAEFGASSAYEDNLLIVFLTEEDSDGYYAIAWLGDNIHGDINMLFGGEGTAFWRVMNSSVNQEYHAYSLGQNLATVMEQMTDRVTELGVESSFRNQSDQSKMITSHLTNYTNLQISQQTVDSALQSFTEATDIPAVIVVDSMENVFGKTVPMSMVFMIVLLIGLVIVAIWLIVRAVKQKRERDERDGGFRYQTSNDRNNSNL